MGKGSFLNVSLIELLPRRKKLYVGIDTKIGGASRIAYEFHTEFSAQGNYPEVHIGNRVHATRNLTLYCGQKVDIADDVLLGSNVLITDVNHGMNPEVSNYLFQASTTAPITIGKGAWIGEQCCSMPGSSIGEKSVRGQ